MNYFDFVKKSKECVLRFFQHDSMLLEIYDQDNERFRQRVGHDRTMSTYQIRLRGRGYVADYVKQVYGCNDFPLKRLSLAFIDGFCAWLSVCRGLHGGTVWLNCMLLKGVVRRACQGGLLKQNPFVAFHVPKNIRQRVFLTEEELGKLMSCKLSDEGLAYVRDLFVFSCYTGLSYVDVRELTVDEICTINGGVWIVSKRHKTSVPFEVKLLDVPLKIVARYKVQRVSNYVFPPCEYRTLCNRLKRIMTLCGISKPVTFHCARHTFATLALSKGMPIESVSRILGHTNIRTTQVYARITIDKLDRDMDMLAHRLSGKK